MKQPQEQQAGGTNGTYEKQASGSPSASRLFPADPDDPRVTRALEEYLAALEECRNLDRQEFLDRHPEIREPLAKCLDGLEFIRVIAPQLHDAEPIPAGAISESPAAEHPASPLGDFRILREIGRGGMGVVYEAIQLSLGRRVALKILPFAAALDPKQLQRFKNEAQAAAHLHHTNIVPVFGVGCERGVHYFAMQYIEGQTLAAVIGELRENVEFRMTNDERMTNAQSPSPKDHAPERDLQTDLRHSTLDILSSFGFGHSSFFRTVASLGIQAAQALEHAHQLGIVHRDIKPANLLLEWRAGEVNPLVLWITDFGLAHCQSQAALTMTGDLIGTLRYMSPEQALAKRPLIDHRTDIYSLGVTLYELLTLEPAFSGSDREELLQQIAFEQPLPPRKRNKAIPRELETIVLKAIAKSPEERYATAQELTDDLRRFLECKPIRAKRPTRVQRASKWCRRNPLLAGALTAVAASLLLGTLVAWLLAVWAFNEKGRATEEAERAHREAYTAKLRLMQLAWDNHNMLQLQELLRETAAFPERGFEWYYWQRLCHVEHVTLVGHTGGVTSVAFAPDGKRLATGGDDGTARIWDAENGQELFCLRGHRSKVTAVAFAPNGQWLVTGSTDGTAKLWDVSRGRELRALHRLETGPVWAVGAMPDGQRVVTGNQDGTARVWDAVSGQELLTLNGHIALRDIGAGTVGLLSSPGHAGPALAAFALYPGRRGHPGAIWAIAVTPDGKRLATAGEGNVVLLWDAVTGRQLRTFLGGDYWDWGINSIGVTPDGKRLLIAGNDNGVWIWHVDTGRELLTFGRPNGWLLSIAVTPDGQRLITGHGAGAATVWDIATGQEIMTLMGHTNYVTGVTVSPDGRRLATASLDGTARVWNLASGAASARRFEVRTIKAHTKQVNSVAVTPDGQRIVTGSADGTAKVWDMTSGHQLLELKGGSVAVTAEGQRIITGTYEGTARVWDAVSGHLIREFKEDTGIRSMALTPDGQRLVTGNRQVAQLWDLTSGQKIPTSFKGPNALIFGLAVTPDGRRVIMGCWNDGTARLFDISNGQELRILQEPTGNVKPVILAPDGRRLITGRSDGTATVWDTANGQRLFSLQGHTDFVSSIAFTPDGQRIVTASVDGTVRLWDAVSGRQLLTLNGHAGPVKSVAVTPDGRRLIAGCEDGTVRIWEAASPEQAVRWAQQDQEVERRRAAWQRPDPSAPGFIRDWLVLAPAELEKDQRAAEGIEREQLFGEASLQPREGESVRLRGEQRTWQVHHAEEPVLDFNRLVCKPCDHSVAYAVCYVISMVEQHDLVLQVSTVGGAQIYLNGEEVYKSIEGRSRGILEPSGPVTLRKGTNVLVLKVVHESGAWPATCVRFVDREGNPVQDLQVRLKPE